MILNSNDISILTDTFQRKHDYLRISLIDKCNLRCQYCMPHDLETVYSKKQLMSADEILGIAKIFTRLGVKKIRLTGGEPLVRKDAGEIIGLLSELPIELCITTNGILVDAYTDIFKRTGIRSVNVSLDTFNADKFKQITHRDYFNRVMDNIYLLISQGFHVKLNVVVMRGVNDDELSDFVEFSKRHKVHVRFIEFMPFTGNDWNQGKLFPYQEMLERIETVHRIEKLEDKAHSTSKAYQVKGALGTFAFISTMSSHFCGDCNRMRLTADGKMKNCLFSKGETDLLTPFRNGEKIEPFIADCINQKAIALGGQFDPMNIKNRSMILIGG